ncbi:MAG: NUDIX domain-containing protein [Candidatus Bathyarchaeota archaeon]|nr:NUDIX domain-containing protein [Candidatus Bathyarchaeota archaeon]MDH5787124.1 NUDIX domain-containing protein [Candidatus Bathyarchaeota archaeon]
MSDWTKLICPGERRYVHITIYDVPVELLKNFGKYIVKPHYPGEISPAIKDLMCKAVGEQKKKERRCPEPTVGGLILNDEKKVLLAKPSKWKNRFTLPGGHIELGESIEEALKREIKEETGLEITPIRLLNLQEAICSEEFHEPRHFIFLDFLCEAQITEVKVDQDELQEFLWVEPAEALKMDVDSFTKKQ